MKKKKKKHMTNCIGWNIKCNTKNATENLHSTNYVTTIG